MQGETKYLSYPHEHAPACTYGELCNHVGSCRESMYGTRLPFARR